MLDLGPELEVVTPESVASSWTMSSWSCQITAPSYFVPHVNDSVICIISNYWLFLETKTLHTWATEGVKKNIKLNAIIKNS